MSFMQEFFSAVARGVEGSSNEVKGKRQRNSPGGGSKGEQNKAELTPNQINEVSEILQGGMQGLAQVVGTKLQAHSARLDKLEQNEDKDKKMSLYRG